MTVPAPRIHGNEEVCETLRNYLKRAEQGDIAFVAIAIANFGDPIMVNSDGIGDANLEATMSAVLVNLSKKLDHNTFMRCPLPPDPSLDASYVTYNVSAAPLSFDSLVWLVNAEMTRRRQGAPAPLKVNLWRGHGREINGSQTPYKTVTQRALLTENILRPAIKLIGAVETDVQGGVCYPYYLPGEIVKNCQAGEAVPQFHAPAETIAAMAGYRGCVTITLRETDYMTWRNSNIEAWVKFALDLGAVGERVVFVRDTAKAYEPLEQFATCSQASRNLIDRCALYEVAKANLFVANGPATLAQFSGKPWFMFMPMLWEGHAYKINTPGFMRKHFRLPVGGQYPWSAPDQFIVWDHDTYENITAAWERMTDVEAAGRRRTA